MITSHPKIKLTVKKFIFFVSLCAHTRPLESLTLSKYFAQKMLKAGEIKSEPYAVDGYTMDWLDFVDDFSTPASSLDVIDMEESAEDNQPHIIAMNTLYRPYLDVPVRISDLVVDNPSAKLQREMLALVPPPLAIATEAPQLKTVLGSAPRTQIGVQPDVIAAMTGVLGGNILEMSIVSARPRAKTASMVQAALSGVSTVRIATLDDAAIFNWFVLNSSNNSFSVWSSAYSTQDKYVQLFSWVLCNSDNVGVKENAVRIALAMGIQNIAELATRDPPICRVIKNAEVRTRMADVLDLLSIAYSLDGAAIDRFFVANNLTKSRRDRLEIFRSTSTIKKGTSILEWLAVNATDSAIKISASRLLEAYRAQYSIPIEIGDDRIVPKVEVGTEVAFITSAYDRVFKPNRGTYGVIDLTERALIKEVASTIEGKLLPARRNTLEMYTQLSHQNPGKYDELMLKTQADIEKYADALLKYHAMYSADSCDIVSRLHCMYETAKLMEKSGAVQSEEYRKLVGVDIPDMHDRLRVIISGARKGQAVTTRAITAVHSIDLYSIRTEALIAFAMDHSKMVWAAHPMHCPITKQAHELLARLAEFGMRITRFKVAVRTLRATIIPALYGASESDTARRLELACDISTSFNSQSLVDAMRSSKAPAFYDADVMVQDIEKSALTTNEIINISREIYAARKFLEHITASGDRHMTVISDFVTNYVGAFIDAMSPICNVTASLDPRPESDHYFSLLSFDNFVAENAGFMGNPIMEEPFESMAEPSDEDVGMLMTETLGISVPSAVVCDVTEGEIKEEDISVIPDKELGLSGVIEFGSDIIEGFTPENRSRYTLKLDPSRFTNIGAYPPIVTNPTIPYALMLPHMTFVPACVPSLDLMRATGKALALAPGNSDITQRAYFAVIVPMLNMLREYERLVPDYTNGDTHIVRGLSAIMRYTVADAPPFPAFPFTELDRFLTRFHNLSRQFPLHIGVDTKDCYREYIEMISDTSDFDLDKAYIPVWFNTIDADQKWKFGRPAPVETAVVPMWSPMPDIMSARSPKFSVPDGFVMPNSLNIVRSVSVKGKYSLGEFEDAAVAPNFSDIWAQDLYGNRIFLIPGGKIAASVRAYRVGRFVARCNFLGDAFYSWQAEMGAFEDISGNVAFIPRQHVCLLFSHSSSAARLQFNNRAQISQGESLINGPHMQSFYGVMFVRCCVSSDCPTSAYENGPWYCGVFGSFDGTLKSYLEGPDMEMHDIYGSKVENLRGEMLKYSANGVVPYDMRFKPSRSHTPQVLWSRIVTYVYVIKDVLDCLDTALRTNYHTIIGVCPENFVYDTKGLSLANVANSLYTRHSVGLDDPALYLRATNYDIATARRFSRELCYNFKLLGIGSSCNFNYSQIRGSESDASMRCLPLDIANIAKLYPRWHASDPFLPHNLVNASSHLNPQQIADHRLAITCEQAIILARYVFFKMGLCNPDACMTAAHIQASPKETAISLASPLSRPFAQLMEYAYDTHDIGLLFSQQPDIFAVDGRPVFILPDFVGGMLASPHPTAISKKMECDLTKIITLLSETTEFNALGTDPSKVVSAFTQGTESPLNVRMYARFTELRESVRRAVGILNSTMPTEFETTSNQLEITPLL